MHRGENTMNRNREQGTKHNNNLGRWIRFEMAEETEGQRGQEVKKDSWSKVEGAEFGTNKG